MNMEEIDYWLRYFSNHHQSFMSKDGKNIHPYDISDYTYDDIINTILSKYYEIIEK